MPAMPNPWLSDSAAVVMPAADATVSPSPLAPVSDETVAPFDDLPCRGGPEGTPAAAVELVAAGATDPMADIAEIFRHYNRVHRRFVLDVRAFMEAIEEPPLFLQMSA